MKNTPSQARADFLKLCMVLKVKEFGIHTADLFFEIRICMRKCRFACASADLHAQVRICTLTSPERGVTPLLCLKKPHQIESFKITNTVLLTI